MRPTLFSAALAFAALQLSALGCRPEALPVLGTVPPFKLISQTGKPFDSSSLTGHAWIADFIYTNCPGPCPLMSRRMRQLQQKTDASVQFVSFTVDPARDTPGVLAAYASRFAAAPNRWNFLTGDPKTLQILDRDAFKLGDLNPSFGHSTRFVLVDSRSRIRGYYALGVDQALEHIVRDISNVEHERS